jgi:hypothetical protein
MATNQKKTKAQALAQVQALIAGLQKHFSNAQLTFGNVTYSVATLVTLLQKLETAMTDETNAEAAAKDAGIALRLVKTQVNPVMKGLKGLLLAQYGNATQTLGDFGLEPRKEPAPQKVKAKAAAVDKREATREARGTKGPKAKLAIKGTAATPAETPPAAPAATPPAKPAGP